MDATTELRERAVSAADRLYYARGVQSVGMDELRSEVGVSLKKLYSLFPSKEAIVLAVLDRRHQVWTDGIEDTAAAVSTPREKLLAIYDFLFAWFSTDDFNGCGFINAFGELGATVPSVAEAAREQKLSFQAYVAELSRQAGAPDFLAPQLALLAEGAQTTAAISGSPESAHHARAAAVTLIDAALAPQH
ncbi:TetR family transcriptional regulator [Glaciihabitans tibetensis]|uniref:TetR family transcriptional regulator n=1 Tax=Glaciihabitans tibetensis TaxID=1266600 RepID=A0A2T0V740_9MICO|nr:TetR/AcrR family transcriptional regulator [Glaciihabitans tibetensis]PRY65927.1 TetR family transcriptional regulator [Glaciihabitans tibetensis]